ncbi:MAG: citrate lyase acyl carrier protein [Candidatus Faecousia sp.]|nr:citrate lyase acyl carrier protein [Candidatus Faecousia sp.]
MILKKSAMAGTMESSDVMITVAPNGGNGITIDLQSDVAAQFGDAIRETVMAVLAQMEVTDAAVTVLDRGALDCAIRARTRCALCRAAEVKYDWAREDS